MSNAHVNSQVAILSFSLAVTSIVGGDWCSECESGEVVRCSKVVGFLS
jgi:hypothetical protein